MTSSHLERQEERIALHQMVDEAADLVVTFDGRLSFEPTTSDGQCTVRFTSPKLQAQLTIDATIEPNNLAVITFCAAPAIEDNNLSKQIYHGPLDKKRIRNELGLALADWYGTVIRSQSQR